MLPELHFHRNKKFFILEIPLESQNIIDYQQQKLLERREISWEIMGPDYPRFFFKDLREVGDFQIYCTTDNLLTEPQLQKFLKRKKVNGKQLYWDYIEQKYKFFRPENSMKSLLKKNNIVWDKTKKSVILSQIITT